MIVKMGSIKKKSTNESAIRLKKKKKLIRIYKQNTDEEWMVTENAVWVIIY